jgi:phospholipid/cholesterol/gamma-HCH transport system substrate-binding protein
MGLQAKKGETVRGEGRLSLVVGTFVVACLAAGAAVVLSLSAQRGFFAPRYSLIAHFENVLGLQANAPVWLAGKEVGNVESVRFGALGGRHPLEVELRIDSEVQELIRADSTASVGTIGVLGDSYIELSIGTLQGAPLRDGDEIRAVTPIGLGALISKAGSALDGVGELAGDIDAAVGSFNEGGGGAQAAQAITAVSEMALEIQQGEGLLHSLIFDSYEGGGVQSIESSLASLEQILNEVRTGEGILHELIYTETTEQDLVVEVLEAGARLNSILGKIDRGEGSLGLLLNDPTLYEDLKILVGGAQRSTVVRSLIRMAVEAGDEGQ